MHVSELLSDLLAEQAALDWMKIAQVFAGPPTTGPER